jgi:Domain of unknown function (DUF4190)
MSQPPMPPGPPRQPFPQSPPLPPHGMPVGSQPPYMTNPYVNTNPEQQVRGTNVMSILSLVFAFVFPLLGIVFGHIARKQIRRTGEGGSGLATAGLVLGYIFTVLWILYVTFIIVVLVADPEFFLT